MRQILRALQLFGRERSLWKYALTPLLWAAAAYLAVAALTIGLLIPVAKNLAGDSVGTLIGVILGLAVVIGLGGSIYLTLVGLIAGFGFDRLSQEVELRAFGRAAEGSAGFVTGIGDGLGRAVLAAVLGLIALCGSGTLVVPWIVAAMLCLLDFTAPALRRRGVHLSQQFRHARKFRGSTSFAFISGGIMLVPVLNVLALPILVAAGTLLVSDENG